MKDRERRAFREVRKRAPRGALYPAASRWSNVLLGPPKYKVVAIHCQAAPNMYFQKRTVPGFSVLLASKTIRLSGEIQIVARMHRRRLLVR